MPRKAGIPNMPRPGGDYTKIVFRVETTKRAEFEGLCDRLGISMTEQLNLLMALWIEKNRATPAQDGAQ